MGKTNARFLWQFWHFPHLQPLWHVRQCSAMLKWPKFLRTVEVLEDAEDAKTTKDTKAANAGEEIEFAKIVLNSHILDNISHEVM